ncbi:MAG: hypothetical protein KKH98_12605 [Spirochaetes bacterium]|nr:hypothetical protein [Spirochaetota bacterium]
MLIFIFFLAIFSKNSLQAKNDVLFLKMHYYIHTEEYSKAHSLISRINVKQWTSREKAELFNTIGFINYKMNNYDEALKYYYLALKFNPELSYVNNNIGIIFYSLNQYKKAKTYFLKAYSLQKKYPKVLFNLCLTDFILRDYKNSFKWFRKAVGCDEKYVRERFNEEKALTKLDRLMREHPEDQQLKKIYRWAMKDGNFRKLF